jgi:hypothetical protein
MYMSQQRRNNDNIKIDLHTLCQLLRFHGIEPENVVTNSVENGMLLFYCSSIFS